MPQTKADLLRELRSLEPYQFAFFALRRGCRPVRLRDDNPDPARRRRVEILDPGSPTGGVVLEGNSCRWAGDWCSAAVQSQDVWACDMSGQVHQLQREAWDAKKAS